jgi:hypothetical protein
MTVKSEKDSIMYKINSILGLEKLYNIAKEKKFSVPSENAIINVKEMKIKTINICSSANIVVGFLFYCFLLIVLKLFISV